MPETEPEFFSEKRALALSAFLTVVLAITILAKTPNRSSEFVCKTKVTFSPNRKYAICPDQNGQIVIYAENGVNENPKGHDYVFLMQQGSALFIVTSNGDSFTYGFVPNSPTMVLVPHQ